MKKWILRWLFDVDAPEYFDILKRYLHELSEHRDTLTEMQEEIKSHRKSLITILKLIKICENHGIALDKEIEEIKDEEVLPQREENVNDRLQ